MIVKQKGNKFFVEVGDMPIDKIKEFLKNFKDE